MVLMVSDGVYLEPRISSAVTHRDPADLLLAQLGAMRMDICSVGPRECHLVHAMRISEEQFDKLSPFIGGD